MAELGTGFNLFKKVQKNPLIKGIQNLFQPKDKPISIEEQKELFKQVTPQPTPEPLNWEEIEAMAGRVNAPIPQHRYIEFGKSLPTLARNPKVSEFKISDEVKKAIDS